MVDLFDRIYHIYLERLAFLNLSVFSLAPIVEPFLLFSLPFSVEQCPSRVPGFPCIHYLWLIWAPDLSLFPCLRFAFKPLCFMAYSICIEWACPSESPKTFLSSKLIPYVDFHIFVQLIQFSLLYMDPSVNVFRKMN